MTTMTATEATHFNISQRAKVITRNYHLLVSRNPAGEWETFIYTNALPLNLYKITMTTCACSSFDRLGTCKHVQGMPEMLEMEIANNAKYVSMGFDYSEQLRRLQDIELDHAMSQNFEKFGY